MFEQARQFLSRIRREPPPATRYAIGRVDKGMQPLQPDEVIQVGSLCWIAPVTLPDEFLETNTLAQLRVGESGYTVPWAMAVTETRLCLLNGKYPYDSQPGGTVQMLVKRDKNGYEVYVPRGYKYQPSSVIPWGTTAEEDLIPVSKVNRGRREY